MTLNLKNYPVFFLSCDFRQVSKRGDNRMVCRNKGSHFCGTNRAKMSHTSAKVENDPWLPLLESSTTITSPPVDPLRQMIDSERYIESLEKKLNRIKGKYYKAPSSADIINSLALFRDDQMRRFMVKEPDVSLSSTITPESTSSSYIQRRLHPERQAINVDELFELLKDDELARLKDEQNVDKEVLQDGDIHDTQ